MKKDKEQLINKWTEERNKRNANDQMFYFITEFIIDLNRLHEREDKQIKELESCNDELTRDNNQLRNALDNQQVLSHEWIGENVKYAYFDILDGSGRLSSATAIIEPKKLENLLVPNQELPVIPEYVADWIKEEQGTMSNWKLPSRFISDSKYKKDQRRYKWSQVEGNMDKFMSALINSYEVDEVRYHVRVPYSKLHYYFIDNGCTGAAGLFGVDENNSDFELTEDEINKYLPGISKEYWEEIK